jgi:hypothetical protein
VLGSSSHEVLLRRGAVRRARGDAGVGGARGSESKTWRVCGCSCVYSSTWCSTRSWSVREPDAVFGLNAVYNPDDLTGEPTFTEESFVINKPDSDPADVFNHKTHTPFTARIDADLDDSPVFDADATDLDDGPMFDTEPNPDRVGVSICGFTRSALNVFKLDDPSFARVNTGRDEGLLLAEMHIHGEAVSSFGAQIIFGSNFAVTVTTADASSTCLTKCPHATVHTRLARYGVVVLLPHCKVFSTSCSSTCDLGVLFLEDIEVLGHAQGITTVPLENKWSIAYGRAAVVVYEHQC